MSKQHSFYDSIDQIACYGISKGIFHLHTSSQAINGSCIIINDKPVINFGSCSYLGLEFHPAIKAAAQAAIEQFGTQFSASRAYISLGLYAELQQLVEKIFDAACVITPTTTLAHIAALPVLIEDGDAVIMDQQVHSSVQGAVQLLKPRGIHIELVRHNRMDLLEERIKELQAKHKKIWYLADGIYSMFGDCCPVDTIYAFLEKYPALYFYVDDAHGMSIHGKHGRGFALSRQPIHTKMVMATSMNKAFASGGGLLVCGDQEMARKIGNVGGPLLSSGPMQPSGLGAAIASARIHLSNALPVLQAQLQKKISFTLALLKQYRLPLISEAGAAIFFVAVSYPKLGHNIVARMLERGFYVNLGIFPTVPLRQTGIRFTVTLLHEPAEIESMVRALAEEFPLAMAAEGITLKAIYKGFKQAAPVDAAAPAPPFPAPVPPSFTIKAYKSITEVDAREWDQLFESRGNFDWHALKLLEAVFHNNPLPEDNWIFDYLIARDLSGNIIAATFLTTALWKDDMLSPAAVSAQVEEKRKADHYYLTSKVLCSGSLFTQGEHLYINRSHPQWKAVVKELLEKIYALREMHQASHIVLRDFQGLHRELDHLMMDNGFLKIRMPNSYAVTAMPWKSPQEFYDFLSVNNRSHIRKKVLRHISRFEVEVIQVSSWEEEIDYWYGLYLNVKAKSLELNTFTLPLSLFKQLALDENWEVLQLTLNDNPADPETKPCCMVFSYKTIDAYIPMIIGMDYTANAEYGIYRQALYQIMLRAKKTGKTKVLLGFSAGVEKQKLGAQAKKIYAYMHTHDGYNLEQLALYAAGGKKQVTD